MNDRVGCRRTYSEGYGNRSKHLGHTENAVPQVGDSVIVRDVEGDEVQAVIQLSRLNPSRGTDFGHPFTSWLIR